MFSSKEAFEEEEENLVLSSDDCDAENTGLLQVSALLRHVNPLCFNKIEGLT